MQLTINIQSASTFPVDSSWCPGVTTQDLLGQNPLKSFNAWHVTLLLVIFNSITTWGYFGKIRMTHKITHFRVWQISEKIWFSEKKEYFLKTRLKRWNNLFLRICVKERSCNKWVTHPLRWQPLEMIKTRSCRADRVQLYLSGFYIWVDDYEVQGPSSCSESCFVHSLYPPTWSCHSLLSMSSCRKHRLWFSFTALVRPYWHLTLLKKQFSRMKNSMCWLNHGGNVCCHVIQSCFITTSSASFDRKDIY